MTIMTDDELLTGRLRDYSGAHRGTGRHDRRSWMRRFWILFGCAGVLT